MTACPDCAHDIAQHSPAATGCGRCACPETYEDRVEVGGADRARAVLRMTTGRHRVMTEEDPK